MNGLGLSFSDAYVFARNSGRPAFLLDFAQDNYSISGARYSTLANAGVTFSRGTNATLIDSTGQLTFAPSNQFTNSESFAATNWSKTGLSATTPVVSNTIAAPNGTITADKIAEDGASSAHYTGQTFSSIASVSYTASIYAKAAERQYIQIILVGAVASPLTAGFDLSGSGTTVTSAGSTSVITSVGDGWYRCSITATATVSTAGASIQFRIATSLSTTPANYPGTDGSGLYIWGAQFGAITYETAPRAYNSTTPKNLLGFTEEFDVTASGWGRTNIATVNANASIAPNGTTTADKVIPNTTSGSHIVGESIGTVQSGNIYTLSVYAKADGYNFIRLNFGNVAGGGYTFFDVLNGTIGGTGSTISNAIENVGNGWFRCSVVRAASSTALLSGDIYVQSANNQFAGWAGNGTDGVLVWGAQISDSASVDPYVYNPAAALTSTAYYGPRFDYDPVTLSPLGFLIEEARTNLMFPSDANAGWSASPGSSVVATANAAISPDGTANATKLATNDAASNGHVWYKTYTGAINTAYCGSAYFKAGEYTRAQMAFDNSSFATTTGALFDLAAGTVVATGAGSTAIITAVGNGWYRCSITATSVGTSGNYVVSLTPVPSSVTTFNSVYVPASTGLGIYVYGVQIEAAGFATSFIPTVNAAATRSADVATMVGNNFTNWYNQTTGTLAVSFDASANAGTSYISASNGSIVQNSLHIDNQSGNMRAAYRSGSAEVAAIVLGAIGTAGTANKIATAYAVNDFAASRNGGTVVTDTSGALPVSLTQLNIGVDDRLAATYYTNGHIKSISYYNTRLRNDQLQVLTA